ncbi:MAG: Smr/MutS family protein [Verrucomicrobiota bacterium]
MTSRRHNHESDSNETPVELPIDGVLELHTFRPSDVKEVVTEYLAACRERGILEVRVIHGKGIGNLQRTVHALLSKHPDVISYSLASAHFGGSGATIVRLQPMK